MKLLIFARPLMLTLFVFFFLSAAINAQTTVFTYQGRLTDTSMPASGTYDLQFALYDGVGTQIGTTQTLDDVTVTNGAFSVQLNFGVAAFPGANRVLEIAVRHGAETGAFTILAPRQPVTSAPYAIRALNAASAATATNATNATTATTANNAQNLGGVAASQFVQTNSTTFVRNQTTQQTAAAFNISGTGAANIFNAQTQYNILGNHVLSVGAAGSGNLFAGAGAGSFNTSFSNSFVGAQAGSSNTTGSLNTMIGYTADVGSNDLTHATAIGARSLVSTSNTIAMGRPGGLDKVVIYGLGAAGSTTLCRNAALQISACSSSLRYKNNIASFSFGLNVVKQLRPISFNWKEGGMKDVGFGAEDVAQINPLLVTYNEKGEVEGVKYDRLSVIFVNAFKEQQMQTEQLRDQVKKQEVLIEGLIKLVCQQNTQAAVCMENK